jgi:hypothetical protein
VYGFGFCDDLDQQPIVFQVPDFGDRFWVYALYDARTDEEFSEIGKQYGTKPGCYMIVGPNWKGETPDGITAILRSSTTVVRVNLAFSCPRLLEQWQPEAVPRGRWLRRLISISSPTSPSRKAGPRRRPRRRCAMNYSANGRRRPTSGRCR